MNRYLQELKTQRWDDHRYYHHSRINQSLHLLSAIVFVISYVLLFIEPAWAALLAWSVWQTVEATHAQPGGIMPGYQTIYDLAWFTELA